MRLTLALLAVVIPVVAAAADIVGVPSISHGDTVEIAGTKVRLDGIEALETDQFCLRPSGQAGHTAKPTP